MSTDALAKYAPLLIDPPVLQPAGLYLELAGEELRKRAFLIEEYGAELCLRPDMTVPACRAALAMPTWDRAFAVRYEGLVFRRQSALKAGAAEFTQIGAEWFAPQSELNAREPEIIAAALETCRLSGAEPVLRFGDVSVFAAIARAAGLAPEWSERFVRAFSRAGGVAGVLREAEAPTSAISPYAKAVADLSLPDAAAKVQEMLDGADIPLFGGRSVEEIAARLRDQGVRAARRPNAAQLAPLREALAINDAPEKAFTALDKFGANGAAERLKARWAEACKLTKPPADTRFVLGLGRGISYYDGFVFELEAPRLGPRASLGGGGRYDGLLQALANAEGKQNGARGWGAAGFALRPKRLQDAAA
jgi:ATP phosphoribosyltransferase regulatory subunit